MSAGEEELLGTLLTVGSTDADRQSLGGYGRLSQAAFGSLDSTVLRVGAAEHEVTAAVLNDTGMFALGDPAGGWRCAGLVGVLGRLPDRWAVA